MTADDHGGRRWSVLAAEADSVFVPGASLG